MPIVASSNSKQVRKIHLQVAYQKCKVSNIDIMLRIPCRKIGCVKVSNFFLVTIYFSMGHGYIQFTSLQGQSLTLSKFVQQRRKYKYQSNHTENEDTFLSSFVGHANVEHVSHIFTSLIISYSYRHMLQLLQCPYIVASTQPNQYGFWSLIWHAEKAALDIDRGYPPIVCHLEKQIVQCRYKTTPRNIYYEVDSISYTYQLTTTN